MQLNFIPYTEKYMDFVAETYNYYVLHSTATYHIHALSAGQVQDYYQLTSPGVQAFIIESTGQRTGFCLLKPYSSKEGYQFTREVTIYLHPEFLRRGIGRGTLQYLDGVAQAEGVHVLIAGICAENTGSIRLFEKCNYSRCGYFKEVGYKFERWLDVVFYQKLLPARPGTGNKPEADR